MRTLYNRKDGFTIIEVLVSVGILLVFLPFAANMLINSQLLASSSKHKIQAVYAAQQIIESQRQQPASYFAPRLATVNPVNPPIVGAVVLDTKGNYTNVNCATNPNLFCGTATITISPENYPSIRGQAQANYTAVYQPAIGAPINYTPVAHLEVNISWFEQILFQKVQMNESFSTDIIVNDHLLN